MNEFEWAAWKKRQRYTWTEIAAALGVSASWLPQKMKQLGISLERPKLVYDGSESPEDFVWESYLEGYTIEEIKRAMQTGADAIYLMMEGKRKIMPPLTTRWIEWSEKK